MFLLLAFAFLAGIFTVLSPCILPILPAILSAGTAQGKLRPFGIILGLICSFTFFTLTLTSIVQTTGLSPNVLRYAAIGLIFIFGLVMIFPRLSNWFAQLFTPVANVGQRLQKGPSSGFKGGLFFGIALGLLWTPCAGPILAAITTLVATHSINAFTIFMTLSYSIGAGLPMLLIAYGGSKIIQSSRFLSLHAERIRQMFGFLMVLVSIILLFHWDMLLQQKLSRYLPQAFVENNEKVQQQLKEIRGQEELEQLGPAPELKGITGWINTSPLTLSDLRGKVVLIDFWTYSCINCLRTLPYLERWYADYQDKGFVIIGVHTPEFEFEKDPSNVASAAKRLGVDYPIALDNNYRTWQAYHNNYWPAHYLIDQEGNIRMVHYGEGAYVETENGIRELLGLEPLDRLEEQKASRPISKETYLGSARGDSYSHEISLQPGQTTVYEYSKTLGPDEVGLKGAWYVQPEYIEARGDNSYLDLNFIATDVYLVLSGSSTTPLEIYLDGQFYKKIGVESDRKYDIVHTSYQRHLLSLKIPSGVRAYAFTFGDGE